MPSRCRREPVRLGPEQRGRVRREPGRRGPERLGPVQANLTGADRTSTTGEPFYDLNTDFTGTGFDPVAAGWTFVPEPGTALLMGLGLAGLASRRR